MSNSNNSPAVKALQAAEAKKALDAKKKAEAEKKAEQTKAPVAPVAPVVPELEAPAPAEQTPTFKKGEFVNPFIKGVTYKMFNKALGEKSVEEYCKDHLEPEQIVWISTEMKHYKGNKKK